MIKRACYGLDWLDAAYDWAETRNVPINAWRDDFGNWCVCLAFRDANGLFRSDPIQMPEQVTISRVENLGKNLDKICVDTRKARKGLTRMVHLDV